MIVVQYLFEWNELRSIDRFRIGKQIKVLGLFQIQNDYLSTWFLLDIYSVSDYMSGGGGTPGI